MTKAFDPRAFSVFGYAGDTTGDRPAFAAYSPSLDDARGDVKAYRQSRPDVRIWQIIDNATDAAEILFTKSEAK